MDCLNCDLKAPIFSFLSNEELELINKNKLNVIFRKGETIRKQGVFMTHVISVNSGLAKLYLEGNGNQSSIIRIVKPTNFIGGPGIFFDRMHHFTIAALTETSVCFIGLDLFVDLLDKNKRFAHEFMKDLSSTILSVYHRLILLTQKHMPGRMADTILYLADEIFQSHSLPPLLSKQDFADMSGMAKDSAIKMLRQFHEDKLIRFQNNSITILNYEGMKRLGRNG